MIQTADLLRVFHAHRGDAIVVPGRGGRHWARTDAMELTADTEAAGSETDANGIKRPPANL